MRIKIDPITKNEYIFAGGIWVRNFTKYNSQYLSINKMVDKEDYELVLKNEVKNRSNNLPKIEEENFHFPKVIILSDGYNFKEHHKLLKDVPSDVAIFAVNRSLAKWELAPSRFINFYIVNNPYEECMRYLPRKHKYFPSCVSSLRTNTEFIKRYFGHIFTYEPTRERYFGKPSNARYCLDDYRNPICAAVNLAYQFGTQKLMLFCCDDSFEDKRDAAVLLENGLWSYPQQIRSQEIIDANLYWLKSQEDLEVKISNFSSGIKHLNAQYINNEEEIMDFFADTQQE